MFVDSGVSHALMPMSYAESLGIKLDEANKQTMYLEDWNGKMEVDACELQNVRVDFENGSYIYCRIKVVPDDACPPYLFTGTKELHQCQVIQTF